MRVKFDLAGHVDDDKIFFRQRVKRFSQKVEILQEESVLGS